MPELPEVETTRRGIAPALLGRRIIDVVIRDRRLRWPIAAHLEAALLHRLVSLVERRAKYILIACDGVDGDSGTLIVHLGMSGSLRILEAATPPTRHDHWDVSFDSGKVLRFHDPRRFGSAHWTLGDPLEHPLLKKLGPEPLSKEFDAAYLHRVTRKRNIAIKQLIMDAQRVVGVGNIYASEALFRAGISPRRTASRLTRAESQALTRSIREVLAQAIEIGGTTLRDYVNADGVPGYFRQKLFVYERHGQPCRVCRSFVKQFVQGQRSTYWCATCQR